LHVGLGVFDLRGSRRSTRVPPEDRERVLADDFVVWDAVLIFAAESSWNSSLPPPSFSGGAVVDELNSIRAALLDR
jgi:hypothetical protein